MTIKHEAELEKKLAAVLNETGVDSWLGVADHVLARLLTKQLTAYKKIALHTVMCRPSAQSSDTVTVKEAAEILDVNHMTVRLYLRKGVFKTANKIRGMRWSIDRSEVEALAIGDIDLSGLFGTKEAGENPTSAFRTVKSGDINDPQIWKEDE